MYSAGSHRYVNVVSYSPDGKVLAAAGGVGPHQGSSLFPVSGNIWLWDTVNGRLLSKLHQTEGALESLTFSRDGRTLIGPACWYFRYTPLWDWAANKRLTGPKQENYGDDYLGNPLREELGRAAVSPDCRMLAWGGRGVFSWEVGTSVRLWETATRQEICRWQLDGEHCTDAAFSPDGRVLVTSHADGTLLFWDVSRLIRGAARTGKPSAADLEKHWEILGRSKASDAQRAVWALADASAEAVPFLGRKLRPDPPATAAQIKRWVAGLDSERYATRREAMASLEAAEEQARPALEAALAAGAGLEKRQRLQNLLKRLQYPLARPDRLRQWRALTALEQAGTPAARRLLETLRRGPRVPG